MSRALRVISSFVLLGFILFGAQRLVFWAHYLPQQYNHEKEATVTRKPREINQLVRDPRNANRGTKRGKKVLEYSLSEYGYGRSILTDNDLNVIAGNKTLETALELGAQKVIVVPSDGTHLVAIQRTDLDLHDPKTRAMAVADNRASELNLDWDPDALHALAEEIDLSALFDANELEKLGDETSLSEDLDESGVATLECAEQLQQKWQTASGQLWEIPGRAGGPHRIICADCTDQNAVDQLMAGQQAAMTVTDPPWNADVNGGDHSQRKRKGIIIANDCIPAAQFNDLMDRSIAVIRKVADGDLYLVMASGQWPTIDRALRSGGFHWSATIIWVKQSMVLTRRKYHSRFEPLWYGWPEDRKSSFCAGRDQDDVWEFPRPLQSPEHPTMKPIELVARAIFNSSKPGNVIFDPFSGSGTTLLAAEQLGRLCYAAELLPKYVAVALERLERNGLKPRLV